MTLAVPASAFALTGAVSDTPATAATPLHVWAPRRTTVTRTVTVRGQASSSQAGHRAVLEAQISTATPWTPLASGAIGPGGGFSIRTRLRHSGLIRVVDGAATGITGSAHAVRAAVAPSGLISPPLRIAVAAQFKVGAPSRSVLSGHGVVVRGALWPGRPGRTVRVQGRFAGGWRTLGRGRTGPAGGFAARVKPVTGSERRLRVVFSGDRVNAGTSRSAGALTVYARSLASWYNDAGNTACGFHARYGVANRTLPCGTKVRIRYGGRTVTATVDDRGPFVGGRDWDLNQSTAGALGFAGVGAIWVSQ